MLSCVKEIPQCSNSGKDNREFVLYIILQQNDLHKSNIYIIQQNIRYYQHEKIGGFFEYCIWKPIAFSVISIENNSEDWLFI